MDLEFEGNTPQKEAAGSLLISHVTYEVSLDEWTLGLKEENRLTRDYKDWRRFQFISVIRDDHPSVFVRDLGPASDFEGVAPLLIPSEYGADTVGQLIDLADEFRNRQQFAKNVMAEAAGKANLVETFVQATEELSKRLAGKSHMGRSGKLIQRTGNRPKKDK